MWFAGPWRALASLAINGLVALRCVALHSWRWLWSRDDKEKLCVAVFGVSRGLGMHIARELVGRWLHDGRTGRSNRQFADASSMMCAFSCGWRVQSVGILSWAFLARKQRLKTCLTSGFPSRAGLRTAARIGSGFAGGVAIWGLMTLSEWP